MSKMSDGVERGRGDFDAENQLGGRSLSMNPGVSLVDPATGELEFDEEGFCNIELPDSFQAIAYANFDVEDFKDRVVHVSFDKIALADIADSEMQRDLDKYLMKLEGVAGVYREDREDFHIRYKPGQDVGQLLLNIEQLIKLAQKE